MGGPIDEAIEVELWAGTKMAAFFWRGKRYPVDTVQALGTPPTRWWEGQGERTHFRVVSHGHVYELYFDHEGMGWVLSRQLS